jgi:hypothetical protein
MSSRSISAAIAATMNSILSATLDREEGVGLGPAGQRVPVRCVEQVYGVGLADARCGEQRSVRTERQGGAGLGRQGAAPDGPGRDVPDVDAVGRGHGQQPAVRGDRQCTDVTGRAADARQRADVPPARGVASRCQSWIAPAPSAAARVLPSALIAAAAVPGYRVFPSPTVHNATVPSLLAAARTWPSGLKATRWTEPLEPISCSIWLRVPRFQSRIV